MLQPSPCPADAPLRQRRQKGLDEDDVLRLVDGLLQVRLLPQLANVGDDEGHDEVDQDQGAHHGQAHHQQHGEQPGVVVVAVGVVLHAV